MLADQDQSHRDFLYPNYSHPEHRWYEFGHWTKSFLWDGLVIDGIGGSLMAYLGLTGRLGDEAFEKSWASVAEILTAAVVIGVDRNDLMVQVAPVHVQRYIDGAKQTAKEAAKAFVAYDQWEKDPARASGAVAFNVGSLIGLRGAALPVKLAAPGGRAARVAHHLADSSDPVTLVNRAAARPHLPSTSDVTGRLRELSTVRAVELPDGRYALPDGTTFTADGPMPPLPPGRTAVELPDGTIKLDHHHLTPEGDVIRPDGDAQLSPDVHGGIPERADAAGKGTVGGGPAHAPRPLPELTPEARDRHWGHLEEVENRSPHLFERLQRDPDKNGGINKSSSDEARVDLDLREQGRVPDDISRPSESNLGDLYSPSTGVYYDIKGVHSDWPPFSNVRNKSLPFNGRYDPDSNGRWVEKLRDQIVERGRVVILDVRNADQAAIDDLADIVRTHGWEEYVVWYP
ncbi:hypothetical protein V1J52_22430 [Streptomyces sp. TRM 70351]|uniref:hypothetical protein n=1 Tax=Streptomyces sp. TRM 70351 TaxID=3116552 RepID=UPI002E7B58F9|nr:hypothetical protein [Streptomyces sp. TRM 70351]MEE1930903.1 hypothetical protein [Streptomyces sp. TRM 70351]